MDKRIKNNKNLIELYKKRINQEEKMLKNNFNLTNLTDDQMHNLITRCNWIISLRASLKREEEKNKQNETKTKRS